MIPWKLVDSSLTPVPESRLELFQRGAEFSIRVNGIELMNSRSYGSEATLGERCCLRIADRANARVLVGGLGLGYTLAAALKILRVDAAVVVAELVPAVVRWNRDFLGILAGFPLQDHRVSVQELDVKKLLLNAQETFDAIILDVDNSPDGLTQKDNDWLYGQTGLSVVKAALRPAGVLGVWSVAPDRDFTRRLRSAGFTTEEISVRARSRRKGGRHTIWIASRPHTT